MEKAVPTNGGSFTLRLAVDIAQKAYALERQYHTPLFFYDAEQIMAAATDFFTVFSLLAKQSQVVRIKSDGQQADIVLQLMSEYMEERLQREDASEDTYKLAQDIQTLTQQLVLASLPSDVSLEEQVRQLKEELELSYRKVEFLEKKSRQMKEASWHTGRLKSESQEQKMLRSLKAGKAFERFIGVNQTVLELLALAAKAAKVQSTVLLCGASGTGKELIAEGIHQASPRAQGPLVKINCAAIPENLLESELFGHEKGSFSGAIKRKLGKFELAHCGTIFLDEIGEMELNMQAKLLRVLQNSQFERVGGEETIEVDVRIIAATNQNMERLVKENRFRADLYYRLNVIPIYLPSLTDRKQDIPLLLDHFMKKFSQDLGKKILGIKNEAMEALVNYDWPGNTRELRNIVERMVALTDNSYIGLEDIPACCMAERMKPPDDSIIKAGELFPLAEYEKQIIRAALEKHGSYTAAGKVLGITHKTVAAKAHKYGIDGLDRAE
ncbi:sigma-54 interaction domain-containing protein [Azotosporobacter soli]|uniref:sigma-54 interaction domain-containing protein n=1 Tax=Azotosporobacter soli TaxID=3055040 RepID=UPI0031FE6CE8